MPYPTLTELSLTPIGRVLRSKGNRGDLILRLDAGLFASLDCPFVFLYLDGLPIPFRVEHCSGTKESFLLKLARIDDDRHADSLKGTLVAIPEEEYRELLQRHEAEGIAPDALSGFTVLHPDLPTPAGTVVHISEHNANPLFHLQTPEDTEVLIPVVEEWIKGIDTQRKEILIDFPLDLLDL